MNARPKIACNAAEFRALIAPAVGLSAEDIQGFALCILTDHEEGIVVDVLADAAKWKETAWLLAKGIESVASRDG